jgi:hypothetical protein
MATLVAVMFNFRQLISHATGRDLAPPWAFSTLAKTPECVTGNIENYCGYLFTDERIERLNNSGLMPLHLGASYGGSLRRNMHF